MTEAPSSALPVALSAERLRACCDTRHFGFETTATLEDHPGDLGQARAMEALRFGLGIGHDDYHVFVLGEAGCGKHATAFRLLRERASARPVPPDLCYLHNFDEPLHPRLLMLPAGRGAAFRAEMQAFIRELKPAIDAALGSAPHSERIEALQDAHKAREDAALREMGEQCAGDGLALLQTADGFVFMPAKSGTPRPEALDAKAFAALPAAEHERIDAAIDAWSDRLAVLLDEFPGWRASLRKSLAKAAREALVPALAHLLREPRARYADLSDVLAFLGAVEKDVLDTAVSGIALDEEEEDGDVDEGARFPRYQVKLLVDHSSANGAPVVFEDNPGYGNLIGRIEHVMQQGVQVSHFNLIRSGALHRANGGYLVVDAERLFTHPYAWEGLKRTLRSGEIRIEPPAEAQGWSGALTLEPQPVPCSLKVVMIGDREIYYTLMESDPEFSELFKIAADFDDDLLRTPDNEHEYARLLAMLARTAGLLPLDRAAVGRMVEEGARIAEDAERLTLHTRRLSDLMREADHHARKNDAACIGRADLEAALAARARRASRYPSLVREAMLDGTTLIATGGARAGQINGLVVVELAGERFGYPSRISATVRLGDGDVVDIERESDLGGAIHSKGVMILSAFLAARYARHQPLSLSASLVFEQSYAPVEGDSASLAELCALLSALTRLPIEQRLAITGSVDQFGEVQVIGGVNEKIEGFFDLCAARGLDGSHGVVIPAASVRHLMLREDVVEAARKGRFHIYPVRTVDEAMTVLTGVPAGEADACGIMPKGSINDKAARALAGMTFARHAYTEGHAPRRGPGGHR
ncbi:MAG: AAA family ATPase [Azoarcus sp.]|jgi:lon-related putative ATP-dependent protease|nr:AAA family ATPase [Azoarcus sp.]